MIVQVSHLCRRCGYELQGLPISGNCPECGGLIERSLRGNLLLFANPTFLRRLAAGGAMVEVGIVLACIVPIGIGLIRALVGMFDDPFIGPVGFAVRLISSFVLLASGLLMLVGWIFLTARDPAFMGRDRSDHSRVATRGATALLAGVLAALAVLSFYPRLMLASPSLFAKIDMATPWIIALILGFQVPSSLAYVAHVAERVPDLKLRSDAQVLRLIAFGLATLIIIGAVTFFFINNMSPASRMLIRGYYPIVAIVYAVLILASIVKLLVSYARVIDDLRAHAMALVRISNLLTPTDTGPAKNAPPDQAPQHP